MKPNCLKVAGVVVGFIGILLINAVPARANYQILGFETDKQFDQWRVVEFPNKKATRYEYQADSGTVCGIADRSAAFLALQYEKSVSDTPVLSWEWKIDSVLENGDARHQDTDDFAARVYVNFKKAGFLSWWQRTKAATYEQYSGKTMPGRSLVFVWANKVPKGEYVQNAFSDQSYVFALESGNERAGEWVRETVNIKEQYRRVFGNDKIPELHSIAFMIDTDNTQDHARGCYRSTYLASDQEDLP